MSRPVASLPREWAERLGPVPGVDVITWDLEGPPERSDEVTYVCLPYQDAAKRIDSLALVPNLRTVQLFSAGYEHVVPHLPAGVRLANARGVHAAATAEQALTLTLAMQRDVWSWVENHRERHWGRREFTPGLADQRVMVVGYGDIGAAIVRRVRAFEPAAVTAVASRARQGDDLVDRVHGIDEVPDLLGEQDVVIVVVPLSEATEHLVDANFLDAMKPGALLVNVGRGKLVDTDALVAACAAGRVRAGLDVTDPEPLPDGHPLWSTPGVLVAPHVGGLASGFWSRAEAMLRGQLERLAAGEPLANIVHQV